MKRRKDTIFVIIFFIVLTIAFKLMSETFARYSDVTNGVGMIPIAKWNFEEDNKVENIVINLLDNIDTTKLVDGKIAPGTKGDFQIKISNKNTEVAIEYDIKLDMSSVPSNLKITNPDIETGTLNYLEEKTLTFNWEWDYYVNNESDEEDTEYMGTELNIPITITGRQRINN